MRPGRGAGQGAVSHTKRIMQYIDLGVFNGRNFKVVFMPKEWSNKGLNCCFVVGLYAEMKIKVLSLPF